MPSMWSTCGLYCRAAYVVPAYVVPAVGCLPSLVPLCAVFSSSWYVCPSPLFFAPVAVCGFVCRLFSFFCGVLCVCVCCAPVLWCVYTLPPMFCRPVDSVGLLWYDVQPSAIVWPSVFDPFILWGALWLCVGRLSLPCVYTWSVFSGVCGLSCGSGGCFLVLDC